MGALTLAEIGLKAKNFFVALLSFLLVPPGIYILLVALVAGTWWWSGHRAYNQGYEECTAFHERLAAIELARQKQVGIEVVTRSEKQGVVSDKTHTDNIRIIDHIIGAANADPHANNVCANASIADQLRSIK